MDHPHRVAIVHEWFTSMRGGEKCVEALCEIFPQAHLYVLVHKRGSVSPLLERMPIHTSFIQRLPAAEVQYRRYLPLFPAAVERFDLHEYDLVISSHHCVAKGARATPGALHICYCYTPMRYIWGMYDEYFSRGRAGLLTRAAMKVSVGALRRWDLRTAGNPHSYVAISKNVRNRILGIYHRTADVIYPPVNTGFYTISRQDDGYFLVVGAFVPYKRIDLAIQACNVARERLVVVGDGPDADRLHALAGPTVEFVGWKPDDQLREYYARCSAVLFPGEEDFGIVPVEAMACGKPVIAYAKGGALETVIDAPGLETGILFAEQTVDAMTGAMRRCRSTTFIPEKLRTFALRFDRAVFKQTIREYTLSQWAAHQGRSPEPQAGQSVTPTLR